MFGRKRKKAALLLIDTKGKEAVIRSSICTGEKVAGFRDKATGSIEEIMLIKDEDDFVVFLDTYHLKRDEVKTIY